MPFIQYVPYRTLMPGKHNAPDECRQMHIARLGIIKRELMERQGTDQILFKIVTTSSYKIPPMNPPEIQPL